MFMETLFIIAKSWKPTKHFLTGKYFIVNHKLFIDTFCMIYNAPLYSYLVESINNKWGLTFLLK